MDRFMTSRRSQRPTTRGRKKENRQSSPFITNLFPCCRPSPPSSTPAEGPDPSLFTLFHHTGKTLTFFRKIARCLGDCAIARFYPLFEFVISVWLQPLVFLGALRDFATRIIHERSLSVLASQSHGPRDCDAGTDRRLRE